jgi:FkbM family methyltransferase
LPPPSNFGRLVVISGGVGEDISFDVELASLYNCRIFLVDPTELAFKHFSQVINCLGNKPSQSYSDSSRQSVSSYDLSNVSSTSFEFLPYALWDENTSLDFFLPPDSSRDSSGSITGIHNFYKLSDNRIKIKSVTISQILSSFSIDYINILKLDIEGAALEVLRKMFRDDIFPEQIIVEVDEMHFPSLKSKVRAGKLFKLMNIQGYILLSRDSCDFLYVRKDILK